MACLSINQSKLWVVGWDSTVVLSETNTHEKPPTHKVLLADKQAVLILLMMHYVFSAGHRNLSTWLCE